MRRRNRRARPSPWPRRGPSPSAADLPDATAPEVAERDDAAPLAEVVGDEATSVSGHDRVVRSLRDHATNPVADLEGPGRIVLDVARRGERHAGVEHEMRHAD